MYVGFGTGSLSISHDLYASAQLLRGTSAIEMQAGFPGQIEQLTLSLASLLQDNFAYRSVHAPARNHDVDWEHLHWFSVMADLHAVTIHPDVIPVPEWREFGSRLVFEGLDHRMPEYQTPEAVAAVAAEFGSGLVADYGHTQYVDPSGALTERWLKEPVRHWHASRVTESGEHVPLVLNQKTETERFIQRLAAQNTPLIWEEIPEWHPMYIHSRYALPQQ